jgi:hypothetical protein
MTDVRDCGWGGAYNWAPMHEENHRESGGVIRFGEYELDPKAGCCRAAEYL